MWLMLIYHNFHPRSTLQCLRLHIGTTFTRLVSSRLVLPVPQSQSK